MKPKTRKLGTTGLEVSALGFGAGHIGASTMSDADAGKLLNGVLDMGITFIDTARGYGMSEVRIGRHLAKRRDEFVLATKCGYGIPGKTDWTPECVKAGIDAALRALRTDHIDLMFFHSCPMDTLMQTGLIEELEAAVQKGKVTAIGYSGENQPLSAAVSTGRFAAIQTSVNLFDQRGLPKAIPEIAKRGMGVIAKRPLGNAPWRYNERPVGEYCEVYWERMRTMGILPPEGMPWGEYAVRFAAHQPGVGTAIVGTSRLEHLKECFDWACKGPLPHDVEESTKRAFEVHGRDWVGQV